MNFLLGCQQQVEDEILQEPSDIEIISEEIIVGTVDEEPEKELEDNLDAALQELEAMEDV